MGEEILDGNVAVDPYKQGNRTACDYCPYHSVCGFDLKTDGYGFRRFKPMKAQEIWKEIDPRKKMGKRWIPVQWKMLQIRSSLYSWIPVKRRRKL